MLKQLALLFFLTLGVVFATQAQTRYVSDELYVNLRSGQGDQYRIIKILPSGTQMTVLESGNNDEWVKVSTENGEEGWLRSQYLQSEPIARDRLVRAQARIEELTDQQTSLQETVSKLRTENESLSEQLQTATDKANRLQTELEELRNISSNAVSINETNQELMEQTQLLETEIDVLSAENERLRDDSNQTWFLYGAIAVGIGVILTLIVQAMRSRKRYSDWA